MGAARKTPAGAGTTSHRPGSRSAEPEDPRGCGDDRHGHGCSASCAGRPPRVRGRRPLTGSRGRPARKTPAGAGTTRRSRTRTSWRSEDPRGCGDDLRVGWVQPAPTGRPPRVRGRHARLPLGRVLVGKTPAGAGTTQRKGLAEPAAEEDPRGCGDDVSQSSIVPSAGGRPPRVRGRREVGLGRDVDEGKTPAGAGTTATAGRRDPTAGEDPRGCGDDTTYEGETLDMVGRPPRVRGRPRRDDVAERGHRKTPAGAGTTGRSSRSTPGRREDPRGCGDDLLMASHVARSSGRPPRVRGRPRSGLLGHPGQRKTPAGAGTTWRATTSQRLDGEDPRGCGDDRHS